MKITFGGLDDTGEGPNASWALCASTGVPRARMPAKVARSAFNIVLSKIPGDFKLGVLSSQSRR